MTVRMTIFARRGGRFEVRWDNPPARHVASMKASGVEDADRPIVLTARTEAELEASLKKVIAIKHQQGHAVWIANHVTRHYIAYPVDAKAAIQTRVVALRGTA